MPTVVSNINVTTQIGQEASVGTGTTAGKVLQSLQVMPGDKIATQQYRSTGHRFDAVVAVNQNWTEFGVKGAMLYTEPLYILENLFGVSTTTTPTGATLARQRVLTPALTGAIVPKTWIVQFGDATDNVNQFKYGMLTDGTFTWDREAGCTVDGKGIGQLTTTGNTFTASPTTLANQPVVGAQLNAYLDTTGAGLGVTQITDEINKIVLAVTGMKAPRWAMNRSYTSFGGHVDAPPKAEVKIDLYESSVTRAIVSNLKLGQTYFLRVDALGNLIEATTPNYFWSLKSDMAFKVTDITAWGDMKNVWGRTITGDIVEDTTWGKALNFTSITSEASL